MHRSKSGPLMSALGHERLMQGEPTGALFPLFPKTGHVNAQQQNAALCHKLTHAVQQSQDAVRSPRRLQPGWCVLRVGRGEGSEKSPRPIGEQHALNCFHFQRRQHDCFTIARTHIASSGSISCRTATRLSNIGKSVSVPLWSGSGMAMQPER